MCMKILYLILWPGEVCTDATDADADTNCTNTAQNMIVKGSLVDKPNEPKSIQITWSEDVKFEWTLSKHISYELASIFT